jgi:hypothetical protein
MTPRQLILRIPNQPGRLSELSELLGRNGLNIRAISAQIAGEDGQVAMVLDDHEKGKRVLGGHGFPFDETRVIAARTPDHPGSMNAVIKPLNEAGVNILRLYVSVTRPEELPYIIIEVNDYAKALATLKANYVDLIEGRLKF